MGINELPATAVKTPRKSDYLWKGIVEDLFGDFLRFFFEEADAIFDLDKGFYFLDKELSEISPGDDMKHPKFVDKLVKVHCRDGAEKWMLIHIEVQGYIDRDFPVRMFTYFYRIRDRFKQEITSLAIFTDNDDKYHPDKYEYAALGTSLTFCFNTYKVKGQDVALLEQSNNPFAVVILAALLSLQRKGKAPEHILNSSVALARHLFKKGFERKKIDYLLNFIQRYVNFGHPELLLKFEKKLMSLLIKLIPWALES